MASVLYQIITISFKVSQGRLNLTKYFMEWHDIYFVFYFFFYFFVCVVIGWLECDKYVLNGHMFKLWLKGQHVFTKTTCMLGFVIYIVPMYACMYVCICGHKLT